MAGDGDEREHDGQDQEQDQDQGGGEEGRITTLDSITERLDRLAARVEEFFKGARPSPGGPGETRPAGTGTGWQSQAAAAEQRRAEIRDELTALKKQESADKLSQKTQDRLGALEKAFEKPPRELRRIEQFFRWDQS